MRNINQNKLTRMRKSLLLILAYLFVGLPAFSQDFSSEYQKSGKTTLGFYMPDDVLFDPAIPKPADVLGFEVGEWHLRHDLAVRYLETLAQASDRVTLHRYGFSHGLRPLVLLTITHPENHENIDDIRERHVQLTDPSVSRNLTIDNMPVVVWLGYSVHGNEHSGANAALLSAYYYAAATGPEIETLLRETVILLDPSFNPDGQDRFATWVNANRHLRHHNADPRNREQNEPWPRARTNHYWFDLNRDWMPLQHPESRGRLEMFHHWKPNVLTDHHEMGTNSTYFFQPGIPSRNNPLTPERNYELTAKLAEYHAEFLNPFGQLYYTKESFDDFYVGKGSTYPDLNGTIGILFEQASSRGHIQESIFGLLDFPTTIRNQFLTSLSTVAGSHALRKEFLGFLREHYTTALDEARRSATAAWVFGDENDPAKTYHLVDILLRHQIEVYELSGDVNAAGKSFRPGTSYIVPASQPQFRLAKSLFETRTEFTDSLFYDVSTWSLPHAFNLRHAELGQRGFNRNQLGQRVTEAVFPKGNMHGSANDYAWLFEWDGFYAPRSAYRLLDAGARLMVASRPFTIETKAGARTFREGTILVASGIQDKAGRERLFGLLTEATENDAVDVYGVATGLSQAGIDLGSPSFNMMRKPEVLMVVGDGVNVSEAGETWHLMDQRYHMPVTKVETDRFAWTDLDRYNTIVLVSGNYNRISDAGVENLRRWVNAGGVIVAYKSAVNWLVSNKLASVEFKRGDRENDREPLTYIDAGAYRGAQVLGGSIFRARMDLTHPLSYGYRSEEISLFRNHTMFLEPPSNRFSAPLRYTGNPLVSGYVSEGNLKLINGSAAAVVSGSGSGRVILLADNPNFRAFWFGTNKLFANSVFFGHTISGLTLER